MRRWTPRLAVAALLAAGASVWVVASEHPHRGGAVAATARPEPKWPLSPGRAETLRLEALRRARVWRAPAGAPRVDLDVLEPPFRCRFLPELPTGTSAKFDCVLESGEVVKIKYGRNPEVAAEVAATRLLDALGYPADRMTIARRVRCDGCPRFPFLAMRLLQVTGLHARYAARSGGEGYSDFVWVAVERKFDAAAIETPGRKGWAWWELDEIDPSLGADRDELDALRLVAVFLAHWDNKSENQRLACLDEPAGPDRPCRRPVAMLQDLGATFGPAKANLARWHEAPVWADRATCRVSMRHLPWRGGTFPDASISEGARARLAGQLAVIADGQARALFQAARFPEHYGATPDDKDLDAWTAAFRHRVGQIVSAGPCPPAAVTRSAAPESDRSGSPGGRE